MLFHIVYIIKLPQVHKDALESHTIDMIKLPHVHEDSLESHTIYMIKLPHVHEDSLERHGFTNTSSITSAFTVQLWCCRKVTSELQKHVLN